MKNPIIFTILVNKITPYDLVAIGRFIFIQLKWLSNFLFTINFLFSLLV